MNRGGPWRTKIYALAITVQIFVNLERNIANTSWLVLSAGSSLTDGRLKSWR